MSRRGVRRRPTGLRDAAEQGQGGAPVCNSRTYARLVGCFGAPQAEKFLPCVTDVTDRFGSTRQLRCSRALITVSRQAGCQEMHAPPYSNPSLSALGLFWSLGAARGAAAVDGEGERLSRLDAAPMLVSSRLLAGRGGTSIGSVLDGWLAISTHAHDQAVLASSERSKRNCTAAGDVKQSRASVRRSRDDRSEPAKHAKHRSAVADEVGARAAAAAKKATPQQQQRERASRRQA